jgi:hypothetical protein
MAILKITNIQQSEQFLHKNLENVHDRKCLKIHNTPPKNNDYNYGNNISLKTTHTCSEDNKGLSLQTNCSVFVLLAFK